MSEDRKRPRALRAVAILVGVLAVVVVAGAITLRAVFTPERLRAEVVRAAHDATGLEVELDDARLSLFPLGVSIAGFRAGETAPAEPFLALELGLVRLDLVPLLQRRVVVEEVRLASPRVSLRKVAGKIVLPGKLGAPAESPAGAPGAPQGPPAGFSGSIEKLEIDGGSLRIDSDVDAEDLAVEGIDLTASLDLGKSGEIASRGELSLAGLSLPALEMYRQTLDELHPVLRFDVAFRGAEGVLHLAELALVAGPADLRMRGEITGLPQAPVASLALAPETFELAELLPLVPPGAWPEGRKPTASGPVTVAATVQGPLADPQVKPQISVTVDVGGAELGMEGFPVGVREVKGKIAATPDRLAIEKLEGRIGDGSLAVSGEVTSLANPQETAYDLAVKADLDLAIVQEAGFAPEGVSVSGRAGVDVRAKGAVAAPERAELSGTVDLARGGVTAPALPVPVHDLAGTIRLAGGNATLEKLSGSLGRSSFSASGVVENAASPAPRIRLEGRSALLDLVELAPPPARGTAAGAAAPAGEGAPLIPPLPPVDATIHLVVDSLLTVGGALSDVELTMKLAGGKAHVETAVAHATFGTVAMTSLRADLDVEGQTARGTFMSPRVEAQRVPLTRVRGEIDLGEDKVLHVQNVAAGLWTGTVQGDATVDLSVPGDPAFSIRTSATGVEANDVVSTLTPAKDLLHGTLNLRSSFAGRGTDPAAIAAGLTGSGDFEATAGRIEKTPAVAQVWNALQFGGRSSIPFKDLASKFAVRDGRLVTDNVVVDSGDALWKLSGAAAFDGTLDYDLEVELGEQLSEHYRRQIGGQLGSLLANTEGNLVLNLEIRGPAAKPRVTVDEQKLLERAKQNAADALQRKLKKEGDNLLGGLKDLIGK
jgi:uncharacterized protein involved in outer membrane biogenesis